MKTKIRVLIVDDDAAVRQLFAILLNNNVLEVVGAACDGLEAITATVYLQPDIVVMDYQMPVLDGLVATRLLKQLPKPPRVIICTAEQLEEVAPKANGAGADAVLMKGSDCRPYNKGSWMRCVKTQPPCRLQREANKVVISSTLGCRNADN